MLRTIVETRAALSILLSSGVGYALLKRFPFPAADNMLQLIALEKPWLYDAAFWSYTAMLFSTPLIAFSSCFALLYIFAIKSEKRLVRNPLPTYPACSRRDHLLVVVGEVHHQTRLGAAEHPRWLTIPERGLFTGIAVFGAIGSGKTSCCMYPFAEQILSHHASDPARRPSALVLEVKGDFCYKIQSLLKQHHRDADYLEISLHADYRYNPLLNDQDSYALAFGIASLLNNLFGRGKEPFWQQAYTNL